MAGLTVVLTGLFPEVGGGSGLNLGKDRVKKMVEAFGGKVTGAVSGRTHILVVGKDPGLGKYSQAQSQPNCQIMVRCMHKAFSCNTIVTHTLRSISKTFARHCKLGRMSSPQKKGP